MDGLVASKKKEAIDQTGLDFKTLSRNEKTVWGPLTPQAGMDQPWDGIIKTMAHPRRDADLPWDDHGFIGYLAELWY